MSEKIWVSQDLDGQSPQRVQWAENVAGLMGIEPVDDLSFTEDNERLQVRYRSEVKETGQRSGGQVRGYRDRSERKVKVQRHR